MTQIKLIIKLYDRYTISHNLMMQFESTIGYFFMILQCEIAYLIETNNNIFDVAIELSVIINTTLSTVRIIVAAIINF